MRGKGQKEPVYLATQYVNNGQDMNNSHADKRCTICVYPLPSMAEPSQLRGTAAAVIDVLRATTVFTFAKHSGVRAIIPVLDIETALQLKRNYPPGEVLLGGERLGLPIEGFDLGNSPQHYTPEMVAGKTLIITTTNGTVAMHAAKPARSVYIASFLNARAVAKQLQCEDNISIICAGTNGKESEEDLLLAGCLTVRLTAQRNYQLNAAAERVAGLWHEPMDAAELEALLLTTTGGRAVLRLGLEPDLIASAQLDTIDNVPQLDW
jgi:2-phosphosulfolactate phosphatase